MVRAAVLTAPGEPLRVADLQPPDPGPGQVRVRIAATGVCHSDLSLARGRLAQVVPAVLGHESAGTVEAVGEGVTTTQAGARVVLCWAPPCGRCWFCEQAEPWLCERAADASAAPYATLDGADVYPGLATAGFAESTVVSERAVLPVPDGVPLEHAAPKDQQVTFHPLELFHFARTLQGCVYGSADPFLDIPRVLAHAAAGQLDLGSLITGRVGLDGIEGAFTDMEAGRGARTVVVLDETAVS